MFACPALHIAHSLSSQISACQNFVIYLCGVEEPTQDIKRYFLHLAYDGTNYHGWQIQLNDHSVQQEIKNALEKILNIPINLIGCGRTDSGVHAKQFYAHFDSTKPLPDKFIIRINAVLPRTIAIYELIEVPLHANARFDAIERGYEYFIHTQKNPFIRAYSYEFPHHSLDWDLIQEATQMLLEYKEFKPLVKMDGERAKYTCIVKSAAWEQVSEYQWKFSIRANRFLYNMIRRIVGTMILIGRKQLSIQDFKRVMDEQSEFKIIKLAPANGLHLCSVLYPKEILDGSLLTNQ